MAKRAYMSHPDPEDIVIGPHTLKVHAVTADQVHVSTGRDGTRINGVAIQASENYFLADGVWSSWTEAKTNHRLTVRRVDSFEDGSPAARNKVLSLFRQAAEIYAEAHPRKLVEAGVVAANNATSTRQDAAAKAEKEYNKALDELAEAEAREAEARAALDAFDGLAAPRM